MSLGIIINYPIPVSLKLRMLTSRIAQFAASAFCGDTTGQVSPEREFENLLERENSTISKICYSYASSLAEFEDLRQDALINIWRGLKSYRGEASRRTWIYRVTVNSCITTVRKQHRHKHDSLDGLAGLIDSEEYDKESIELMNSIIGTLGIQEKAIILMWLDELSYDDIANAMGLPRNTVATKIRRIKEKITKKYREETDI